MRIPEGAKLPLLVGMCGLLLVLLMRAWFLRWNALRRGRRRQVVAGAGERKAEKLLRKAGYRVIDSQVRTHLGVRVDGRLSRYEVRADLLVERDGRRYVGEVKTGEQAPSLQHGPTRRQLLEYTLAYPVEGAVLVDVPAGRVRQVRFVQRRSGTGRALLLLSVGTALGLALPHLFRYLPLGQ